MASFVEAVIERLNEQGLSETPLHEEWRAVTSLDSDEAAFCLAAARLGADPFAVSDDISHAIAVAGDALEAPLRDEFFDAVEPTTVLGAVEWVERETVAIRNVSTANGWVNELRGRLVESEFDWAMPWDVGYQQAMGLRRHLGVDLRAPMDIESGLWQEVVQSPDPNLVGLGGIAQSGAACLVLGQRMSPRAGRFVAGRALWHFLAEPDRTRFLVTRSHAGGQRVARAFAAELLAPAQGIAELLGERLPFVDEADVDLIADHYGVSSLVVEHQIENQLRPYY